MMRLGIIAGNRLLPLILAKKIRETNKDNEVIAICFKGETSPLINRYVTKTHWVQPTKLGQLKEALKKENLKECIMAGQINPLRIFKRSQWDQELRSLVAQTQDFRPHTIFTAIINHLQTEGIKFLDSTLYLKESLAQQGLMDNLDLDSNVKKDIDFGVEIISRFVELDVGQVGVVKSNTVAALESLEGTDRTIKRGFSLAGRGCTVLKFSKANQDLRFDVPVVGISTLRLLKKINAASLVLEKEKVIILEKEKFLSHATRWGIPVVGRERVK
ncbi:MAG: UDP-2,3-diacylglucosamine diphosphatase LpxI [Candidatus Omnitrophota bacterium]|nr:MAG: UDP-2,3-diacylglucosamine diphosphatase LpxI [Candidatus Omnitrophota bacterium]